MRLTPFVVLVLITACPGPKPTPQVTPEAPHLLWSADAQSLDNPFPDQRLITNGALTLRKNWYQPFLANKALTAKSKKFFEATGAALEADVHAFGTFGGTLVLPSAPLDPASLTGHVARLQMTASGWIVLERSVTVQHVSQVLAEAGTPVGDAGLPAGIPEFVFVRPSVPLPENAEGAVVFLKGITTADGKPLEPTKAWVDSNPDISWLATTLGVPESDLLLVVPQASGTLTEPMVKAAAWADAHPGVATIPAHGIVPDDNNGTRPVGVWQSTDADWPTISWFMEYHGFGQPSPHPGTVVVGEFTAKDLRDANLHVVPASLADPSSAADVKLRFVLVLPKGPRPAGGWPIVMGQHGVGGRNTPRIGDQEAFCLEWAEPLTAEGLGCIGIDAPNHGSRGAFTSFFSVGDLPALRDRFREMTFDLLQEERLIATLDVDGDGTPDLNPIARYFGNSLGGIIGAGFVPYANHLSSAVLNVPGAGLSNIIVSPDLHDLIGLLIIAQTDLAFGSPEYNAAFPIFRAGAQPLFEVADPINAAHLLPVDRAVLVQEGLGDQTIPNQTTEDLAAALNLPASLGAMGTTPLRVLTRVDPAKYLTPAKLATYNAHGVVYDFPEARLQVTHFLATDGRELTPP
jgi:hypothetical protein